MPTGGGMPAPAPGGGGMPAAPAPPALIDTPTLGVPIRINDLGDPFATPAAINMGTTREERTPRSPEDLRQMAQRLPKDLVAGVVRDIEDCETLQQSLPPDADWRMRAEVGGCFLAVEREIAALLKADASEGEPGIEEDVLVPGSVEPVSTTGALVAVGSVAALLVAFAV